MVQLSTSSPTLLLWAEQLKREHKCLLDRMRSVEDRVDEIIRSSNRVEASVKEQDNGLDRIRNQISSLEEQQKAIIHTQKTLDAMIKAEDEKRVAFAQLIEYIETLQDDKRSPIRSNTSNIALFVKRMGNLEEKLEALTRTEEESRRSLKRKDDRVDVEVFNRRLDAVEACHTKDRAQLTAMTQRVKILENSCQGEPANCTSTDPERPSVREYGTPMVVEPSTENRPNTSGTQFRSAIEESPALRAQLRRTERGGVKPLTSAAAHITAPGPNNRASEISLIRNKSPTKSPRVPQPTTGGSTTPKRANQSTVTFSDAHPKTLQNMQLKTEKRKRPIAAVEVRETRSRTKRRLEEQSNTAGQTLNAPPQRKRKRREIRQTHDMDRFTAMMQMN